MASKKTTRENSKGEKSKGKAEGGSFKLFGSNIEISNSKIANSKQDEVPEPVKDNWSSSQLYALLRAGEKYANEDKDGKWIRIKKDEEFAEYFGEKDARTMHNKYRYLLTANGQDHLKKLVAIEKKTTSKCNENSEFHVDKSDGPLDGERLQGTSSSSTPLSPEDMLIQRLYNVIDLRKDKIDRDITKQLKVVKEEMEKDTAKQLKVVKEEMEKDIAKQVNMMKSEVLAAVKNHYKGI